MYQDGVCNRDINCEWSKHYAILNSSDGHRSYHSFNYSNLNNSCENKECLTQYSENEDGSHNTQVNKHKIKKKTPVKITSCRKKGLRNDKVSREENKINRNSNKRYLNYKGVEIQPRKFNDYCCKCIKKCSIKLCNKQRKMEFEKFWGLSSYDAQTAYIAAKVSEHPVKKRYGKIKTVKKDFSRSYCLGSTAVCRDMFCKTLQISSGRINTALTKIRKKRTIQDQRGIRQDALNIENTNCLRNLVNDQCAIDKEVIKNQESGNGNIQFELSSKNEKYTDNTEIANKLIFEPNIETKDCCIKSIKVGRKLKFFKTRNENKLNRNSNKPYIDYKGVLKDSKKFVDFKCKCNKNCQQIVNINERMVEFEKFWTLPYNSQTAFLVAAVHEYPIKKRYSTENRCKKDYSRKYLLSSKTVCRDMFCRTLQVSPGRVNTALKKYRMKKSLTDQRGIKQGGHNKLSSEKRNNVIQFLKKVPMYRSQFSKEKVKSKFMSPYLTLTKLYEIYKEEEKDKAVSNASFKKIFYATITIQPLTACLTCKAHKLSLKQKVNDVKTMDIKQKYNDHLVLMDNVQKKLAHDIMLAKKYPEIECLTFEFQKLLPLPNLNISLMYMKHLLWVYNLGIYSAKKDQSYCYVWPETQAGKGAQELGSCILKHLKEEIVWSPYITHVILWTDPHRGLNRNIKLILMLKCFLQSYPNIKSVKLKYLSSDHYSLPNQKDFSDIEKSLKTSTIYLPQDYINVIRFCRKKKPLIAKLMINQDFLCTTQLERFFSNVDKIDISKVCEIMLCSTELQTVYLQKENDEKQVLNIMPIITQPINNLLNLLWPLGKQISPAKMKDLKSLLNLIPECAKHFYINLKCSPNKLNEEDVNGFNDDLDFDIE